MLIPLVALALVGGMLTLTLEASADMGRRISALERLARADALADSGLRRLVAAFADPADDFESTALFGAAALMVGNSTLSLRVEPEAAKIDVLKADEEVVRRYLSALPIDGNSVLSQVIDARQAGDAASALLTLELALSHTLTLEKVRRDFSRFGITGIDPQFASAEVLASVPDLTAAQVRAIAAMPAPERALATGESRYFAGGGRTFSLLVRGGSSAVGEFTRRIPVEISTSGRLIALAGVQS